MVGVVKLKSVWVGVCGGCDGGCLVDFVLLGWVKVSGVLGVGFVIVCSFFGVFGFGGSGKVL